MARSLRDYVPVCRADIRQEVELAIEHAVENHVRGYIRRYTGATLGGIEGSLAAQREQLTHMGDRLNRVLIRIEILEDRMTAAEAREDAAAARLAEVIGLLKAEIPSLREQLAAALGSQEAFAAGKVSEALDSRALRDAERLEALVAEADALVTVMPSVPEVPVVPVPEPGAPAELPDEPTPVDGVPTTDVPAEPAP